MKAVFQKISRFVVTAECSQPLHIGSGENNEDILSKESTGKPFVQGTSLAGVFLSYAEACKGKNEAEKYFGSKKNDTKSRVVFSEGSFVAESLGIEMRTRVRIDGATASAGSSKMKGGGKSGQLMDVEYVSAGSKMQFTICAMDEAEGVVKECLAALDDGIITIGGKSTIGCGQVKLAEVLFKEYDMTNENDRCAWQDLSLSDLSGKEYKDILEELRKIDITNPYYEIEAKIKLRTPLLIKANFVKKDVVEKALQVEKMEKLPDNMPIVSGNDEFIIPGSSLKGVFRSRMETIGRHTGLSVEAVEKTFSDKSDCIFSDSVIKGSSSGTDDVAIQPRIHINKLSGSVMNKQLMTEMTITGNSTLSVRIPKKIKNGGLSPEAVIGLVLFVLRDMDIGVVTLGSGASIGRGFVSVGNISISGADTECVLNLHDPAKAQGQEFIDKCIQSVGGATI